MGDLKQIFHFSLSSYVWNWDYVMDLQSLSHRIPRMYPRCFELKIGIKSNVLYSGCCPQFWTDVQLMGSWQPTSLTWLLKVYPVQIHFLAHLLSNVLTFKWVYSIYSLSKGCCLSYAKHCLIYSSFLLIAAWRSLHFNVKKSCPWSFEGLTGTMMN